VGGRESLFFCLVLFDDGLCHGMCPANHGAISVGARLERLCLVAPAACGCRVRWCVECVDTCIESQYARWHLYGVGCLGCRRVFDRA